MYRSFIVEKYEIKIAKQAFLTFAYIIIRAVAQQKLVFDGGPFSQFFYQLYGMNRGEFSLILYIDIILYNLIPLYVMTSYLDEIKYAFSEHLVIRCTNWLKVGRAILRIPLMFILFYVIMTLVVSFMVNLIINGNNVVDESIILIVENNKDYLIIAIRFCVLKVMELQFVLLLFVLGKIVIDNMSSIIFLLAGYFLNCAQGEWTRFNPFGIAYIERQIVNGFLSVELFFLMVLEMMLLLSMECLFLRIKCRNFKF